MPALWRSAARFARRFGVPTLAHCYVTSPQSAAARLRRAAATPDTVPTLLRELRPFVQAVFMHEGVGLSPALCQHLWELNVRTVFLAGADTEAHILSAAFQLVDAGIEPTIVSPLCTAHAGRAAHDAALDLMRRHLGDAHVYPLIPWGSPQFAVTASQSQPVAS